MLGTPAAAGQGFDWDTLGLLPLDLSELDAIVEIFTAIADLPADRALGLDGFSRDFFKDVCQSSSRTSS